MPTFWNGVSKEDTLQELWSTSKALAQGELIEKKTQRTFLLCFQTQTTCW